MSHLQRFAPDAAAQTECATQFNDQSRHLDPLEMVKWLAHALTDGLDYGNWPWTEFNNVVPTEN